MLNTSIEILSKENYVLNAFLSNSQLKGLNNLLADSKTLINGAVPKLTAKNEAHKVALMLAQAYEQRGVTFSNIRAVAETILSFSPSNSRTLTELYEKWGTSKGRDTYGYNTLSLTDEYRAITCRILEVGGGYDMRSAALGHWLEEFLKSPQGERHLMKLAHNIKLLVGFKMDANTSSQDHKILSQVPYALTMYQYREVLQATYDRFKNEEKAFLACSHTVETLILSKQFGIGRGYGSEQVALVAQLAGLEITAKGHVISKRKGYQVTHHTITTHI